MELQVFQVNPAENTERLTVDISKLIPGLYFMVLMESGKVSNVSKVVISRS